VSQYFNCMFDKIKQIQQLKEQADQMKQLLAQETVQADAAHGKVSIVMNGNQEIVGLSIDNEMLRPEKKDETEKAIKEAANEAIQKSQRVMAQKIQGLGGLNLPGLGM
jgi:nucleoid-associated protein EbfC